MVEFFSLVIVSIMTVGKVLFGSVVGAVVAKRFSSKSSVKGIAALFTRLLLPCLFFTRLVSGLSPETLSQYAAAGILSLGPLTIGLLSATVASRFVEPADVGMLRLGSTFQNGVAFAISILAGLHNVPWLDAEAIRYAEVCIFVYNVPNSVMIWGLGTHIVKSGVASAETTKDAEGNAVGGVGDSTSSPREVQPSTASGRVVAAARGVYEKHLVHVVQQPLLAVWVALFVAMTPLRGVVLSAPFAFIFGGLEKLAIGAVPVLLFLLGAQLSNGSDSSSMLDPRSYPLKVVAIVCGVRLVLVPLVMAGLLEVLLMYGLLPSSRVFHFVMLVESFAPPAINTTVICALYGYKSAEYTKLLFAAYCTSAVTSAFWLTFALWRVG